MNESYLGFCSAGAVLGQNIFFFLGGGHGPFSSFPSPSSSLPLLFPFLSLPSSPHSPLEVDPLNTARGSGELKLFQWGWGGAPAEIEFRAF